MGQREREATAAEARRADAAQRQSDHQRWADDGGPTPDVEHGEGPPVAAIFRSPWAALGVAVALGFTPPDAATGRGAVGPPSPRVSHDRSAGGSPAAPVSVGREESVVTIPQHVV